MHVSGDAGLADDLKDIKRGVAAEFSRLKAEGRPMLFVLDRAIVSTFKDDRTGEERHYVLLEMDSNSSQRFEKMRKDFIPESWRENKDVHMNPPHVSHSSGLSIYSAYEDAAFLCTHYMPCMVEVVAVYD